MTQAKQLPLSISYHIFEESQMSYFKNPDYQNQPFENDCSHVDSYIYSSVSDLVARCENKKQKVIKCRTIGILESLNGIFFIKDINLKSGVPMIQVSLAYVNSTLQSTVLPFAVQLFGTMEWRNRPVIFAKLIQVLNTAMASRLNEAMLKIYRTHFANHCTDDEIIMN